MTSTLRWELLQRYLFLAYSGDVTSIWEWVILIVCNALIFAQKLKKNHIQRVLLFQPYKHQTWNIRIPRRTNQIELLNENNQKIQNSISFIQMVKELKIEPPEILVSCDVVHLYISEAYWDLGRLSMMEVSQKIVTC